MSDSDDYRTTEAGKICQLSQQMINRMCDSDMLESFVIPGSTHRRIPRPGLLRMIRKFDVIPAVHLSTPAHVLLITENEMLGEALRSELSEQEARFLFVAKNFLDAGIIASAENPDLFIIDLDMGPKAVCHVVCSLREMPDFENVPIFAIAEAKNYGPTNCVSVSKTFQFPEDRQKFGDTFREIVQRRRHPL